MIPNEIFFLNLLLYCVIGISIILVVFGLPGTWLMVLAALGYAAFLDFGIGGHDVRVIALLIFAALVGEVFEFLVGTLGAKRMAVSNGAIVSSIVGAILGAVIGVPVFLVGSLLGLFLGAFLGGFTYELAKGRSIGIATRVAFAILISRIVAILVKTSIAVGMGIYLTINTL